MRLGYRTVPLAALALVLSSVTCSFPDDLSSDVYVTIETPALVVQDGEEMTIQARAWRQIGAPDTGNLDDQPLGNVDFQWTSAVNSVARVENIGGGFATVLGVSPGTAGITARAISFEQATNATLPLRVAGFLEIDSMTPAVVKWGDKLTLWGVGIKFAFLAQLTGGTLIPDTLSYVESGGFSRMDFWVPQPSRTSSLFVLGPGVFFNTPDTVVVDTLDLFEPNTVTPSLIDLDGPGPYPTLPTVKFFNPALAFEELPRDTVQGYDWYRLTHSDTTQPLTVIVRPQGVTDSTGLFIVLSDSIFFAGGFHQPGPDPTWFITSEGLWRCPLGFFSPNMVQADSMVLALKTLPRYVAGNNGFHVLNFYGQRLNYTMVAVDEYVTSDPRITADRFEENDICTMADDPTKLIGVTPTAPFLDTLNIDNPHDMDWLRFRVTAPLLSDSTMIKLRSRPFGGVAGDRSDIDFYIMDTGLNPIASSENVGSRDSTRVRLASGDYYLVVVDYQGEPMRYSLCISVRTACIPPFAPPAPATGPRASKAPRSGPFSTPAASAPSGWRSPFRRP
jgi:hypothetical protein